MTAVVTPVEVTAGPSWLAEVRRRGGERFADLGFPTSKDEDWRFTPVTPISSRTFHAAPAASVTQDELAPFTFGQAWPRIVFVNGRHAPELSSAELPAGVTAGNLMAALAQDSKLECHVARHIPLDATPFVAQNTAHLGDGAYVHVAAGADVPVPVHLVFATTGEVEGAAAYPRNLILVDREARVSIIESYISLASAAYFNNVVTEVVVGENAWVEHTRLQREAESAYHIGFTHVEQARDSHYRNFSFAMGGAIARHDLTCRLNAPNTEALMYGLYLGREQQLVDNHTTIHHDHPDCRSWEVYKGVLADRSHGVFNGKIFVKPEAQKTDAKQTNRALLLSEHARIDTKPQLEIFADDVKCTHGATVGFLNDQMRFYLRSRGIPNEAADRHLTYAFCAEVIAEVQQDAVRGELDRLVRERVGV